MASHTDKRAKPDAAAESEDRVLGEVEAVQAQIEKLNDEASERVLQIEREFNAKRRPYFLKRNALLRQVPQFWLTVLLQNAITSNQITAADEPALEHLIDIDVEDFADIKSGFRIVFHFSPNPYFENPTLTKEFHYTTEGDLTSKSTTIKWKPGKDLVGASAAASAGKGAGSKRPAESQGSFFEFFSDGCEWQLELGEALKEDIWSDPLKYYNAPVDEEGDEEEGDEEEGDEEDDGEDDEDEAGEEEA